MSAAHRRLRVRTAARRETIDITERVAAAVRETGIHDGICAVSVAHTTAAVFVNENADPDVQRDLLTTLARLVPDEGDYRHAEGNSPAHVQAILIGGTIQLAVQDGTLALGRWQGVFLAELDGPRPRDVTITVVGERAG